ncbi:uncharacterized protein B4U79_07619, partial [Dinothrombium tinctorium]
NFQNLQKSDVMYVLKPILFSLKTLGLWPRDAKKFSKRLNLQSCFVFVYLHIYSIHIVLNWLYSFRGKLGFYALLDNTSLVVRTLATAAVFDMFFITHFETLDSLHAIDLFPPLFTKFSLRSLRFYIILLVGASWLYVIVQLAFSSWSVATMDSQKFMDLYFYGFYSSHVNIGLMRFLMACVWFTYIWITLSAEIFLKSFYVSTCLLLARCARSYNLVVSDIEAQEFVSGDDINNINKLHSKLCDLVLNVDKNFTGKAFLWVATIFLNICLKIGSVMFGSDASETSAAIMDVVNYFAIFIIVSMTAADVSAQCETVLPVAHRLASKADMTDLTVLYQAKLMISKMSHSVARLTGWNCFIINRPFILTVIGAVLTYSVVLMQMSRSLSYKQASIAQLITTMSPIDNQNETRLIIEFSNVTQASSDLHL